MTSRVVKMWKESLAKTNAKAAQSLADPAEYENLFVGLRDGLMTEQFLAPQRSQAIPARNFTEVPVCMNRSVLS